jgi:hypothetical protein
MSMQHTVEPLAILTKLLGALSFPFVPYTLLFLGDLLLVCHAHQHLCFATLKFSRRLHPLLLNPHNWRLSACDRPWGVRRRRKDLRALLANKSNKSVDPLREVVVDKATGLRVSGLLRKLGPCRHEPEPQAQSEPQPPATGEPTGFEDAIDESKAHLTSSSFYDEGQLFQESEARTAFDDRFKISHTVISKTTCRAIASRLEM